MFCHLNARLKEDGSQTTDMQRDALLTCGAKEEDIYEDYAGGKNDNRPHLIACLKALRPGDTLIVWKLDRLGRDLRHLINTVHDLENRTIGFRGLVANRILKISQSIKQPSF